MSDFLGEGYSLNDYASEGQLFYKPTDKIRFEGALEALCDNDRHVVIVTDDKALADRYYRYFITRIAIRDNIILDTRAPTGADDVLNRFNKILSTASVESARSAHDSDVRHVMAMIDTSNMSDHEWTVLGRLLKNFPGANIRMLAFVSESQLDVIDSVLNKLDGQVYRWILTSPTPEYLEALLEMGEQYNYQSETVQMAAAMGYHRHAALEQADLNHELDALDAHLESLQYPDATASSADGVQAPPPSTNNDFDADLNALLGAIKQSQGVDDADKAAVDEVPEESQEETEHPTDQDPRVQKPSRRLIWATGLTGITLILIALFAPWENTAVQQPEVQISPRTFKTNTDTLAQTRALNTEDLPGQTTDTPPTADVPPTMPALSEDAYGSDPAVANVVVAPDEVSDLGEAAAVQTSATVASAAASDSDTATETEVVLDDGPAEPGSAPATSVPYAETHSSNLDLADVPETTPETVESELTQGTTDNVPGDMALRQERDRVANDTSADLSMNPRDRVAQAENSSYFIQVGVYANPTQAQLLMDALPPASQAFQLRLNKSGRKLNTVLCGPFDTKALADAVAISTLGHLDTWVRSAAAVRAELDD